MHKGLHEFGNKDAAWAASNCHNPLAWNRIHRKKSGEEVAFERWIRTRNRGPSRPLEYDEKVMILCNAIGTRMQEVTEYSPRALVDIGGRPLMNDVTRAETRTEL